MKVLREPCQACRPRGFLISSLRGSTLGSMNVDQVPRLDALEETKVNPEPYSRERDDPAPT